MKRAVAFILSLTVIWLQMLASAQTLSPGRPASAAPECSCCVAKGVCHCCCVTPAEPDAQPLPAIPAATGVSADFTGPISKLLGWTLPETAPTIVSSLDRSVTTLAVPLFTRHCAYLI